jgi:hypothetical protein
MSILMLIVAISLSPLLQTASPSRAFYLQPRMSVRFVDAILCFDENRSMELKYLHSSSYFCAYVGVVIFIKLC